MNNDELTKAVKQAYNDFRDDPTSIHYSQIEERYGTDTLAETDFIADVIDLAIRDMSNDVRRDVDEVLEEIESWQD